MNTPEDPSSSSIPGGAPVPPDTAQARRPASTGMVSIERTFEQATLQFLRERRTERRWRVFFRMAWLLVFVTLAYAIVVHVVIWLPVTLAGFIVLIRQGLGWQAITHAQELETAELTNG